MKKRAAGAFNASYRLITAGAVLLMMVSTGLAGAGDFGEAVQRASAAIEKAMPSSERQMTAGDFDGANATLLKVFPAATRTAAQSFVLGNVLFEVARKQSYTLHQAAAKAEPDNEMVLWEWALEQHRAGEYQGALTSYQKFSKLRPGYAVSYALQADCLLRLNRVNEAITAWQKSEQAPEGSIETMEDLVCAVHRKPAPFQRRAELLARARQKQDAAAAADLIALDCDFPRDWWNGGPQAAYLAHDVRAVMAALKLPPDAVRGRAILCAAKCAGVQNAATIKDALSKYRLLIDAERTIPIHGGLLSVILGAAVESKAIDERALGQEIFPKVLSAAKQGHDVEMWNVAAFLAARATGANPKKQLDIEREGWKATGDGRFAASTLMLKLRAGQLKGDDAELQAALKQFPESGSVQRVAYEVAKREHKITQALLADAARAEFTHFSSFVAPVTVVNRPRSDYLRSYFAQMLVGAAKQRPMGP